MKTRLLTTLAVAVFLVSWAATADAAGRAAKVARKKALVELYTSQG